MPREATAAHEGVGGPSTLDRTRRRPEDPGMWIDERGSEVLDLPECWRLLALGAKRRHHGHLGVSTDSAPLVLPVDYAVHDREVVIQVGERLFGRVSGHLVAFQVDYSFDGLARDGGSPEGRWSVLLRGLASGMDGAAVGGHFPEPRVAEPGHRLVQLRGDVVTGRRLRPPGAVEVTSDP